MKQHGMEHLPPIAVLETEAGKHRVIDGHRRTAAAKLSGHTHIPAWVSPTMSTGKKYAGQDRDIGTSLTYEGAHHGAEAAEKMYAERQRDLMRRVQESKETPDKHRQSGTPERYKYTPPQRPRFEPANIEHYVDVAKRNAEMRMPRQGELVEDARIQNEWTPSREEWRRILHGRDNVHLVDIPTHLLQISERDIAPERQARLQGIQGTDDPIMASIDHNMHTDEFVFNVDDGNNRALWHRKQGHATVPAFLHEYKPGDMEKVKQVIAAEHAKPTKPQPPEQYAYGGREPGDQTDTDEFKEWFGDSQTRHPETGKPLVLYHGTADDFDVFGHDRAGPDRPADLQPVVGGPMRAMGEGDGSAGLEGDAVAAVQSRIGNPAHGGTLQLPL
jgi:hypothetical protein